jgi:hypothetical protein
MLSTPILTACIISMIILVVLFLVLLILRDHLVQQNAFWRNNINSIFMADYITLAGLLVFLVVIWPACRCLEKKLRERRARANGDDNGEIEML